MSSQGPISTSGADDFELDEALDVVKLRREERRDAIREFVRETGEDPDEVLPF